MAVSRLSLVGGRECYLLRAVAATDESMATGEVIGHALRYGAEAVHKKEAKNELTVTRPR